MLGTALRPSVVLRAALLTSSTLLSAATASAAADVDHGLTSDELVTAGEAASVLAQHSLMDTSSAGESTVATAARTQADDEAAMMHAASEAHDLGNALVIFDEHSGSHHRQHRCNDESEGRFAGGYGPRHLTDVVLAPKRAVAATAKHFFFSDSTASTAASPADDGANAEQPRRPVITKSRRIRLAAAASQAAQVLQAASSPATALLHSQRVLQLRAEEALLNASLQRLKAERDLTTVRHTCDEELQNFRRGVQDREQQVVRAAIAAGAPMRRGKLLFPTVVSSASPIQRAGYTPYLEDLPLDSALEDSGKDDGADNEDDEDSDGGDGLPRSATTATADAELLGMPATADAEAASAAAAAMVAAPPSVRSARARLCQAAHKVGMPRPTAPRKPKITSPSQRGRTPATSVAVVHKPAKGLTGARSRSKDAAPTAATVTSSRRVRRPSSERRPAASGSTEGRTQIASADRRSRGRSPLARSPSPPKQQQKRQQQRKSGNSKTETPPKRATRKSAGSTRWTSPKPTRSRPTPSVRRRLPLSKPARAPPRKASPVRQPVNRGLSQKRTARQRR